MKISRILLATLLANQSLPAIADTLVVGNKGDDTVSFIDLATGNERARVATGKAPHEATISPDGRRAAVVAYGGTSVDIFEVSSARLIRRIDLSPNDGPHGIIWYGRNRIVAVAERSRTVVDIDPARGTFRTVSTGQIGSHLLVLSPDRQRAYVSNIMGGSVSIIDLRRMVKVGDIPVGGYPEGLAVTPDGKWLWVGDDSGPRLKVVDIARKSVVETLPTRSIAIRILITPDGKTAIVSNMASGTIELFDVATRKLTRTIEVSSSEKSAQITITLSRDGKKLYVAETADSTIAEVDLVRGKVVRRMSAGKNGDGLAIAP